MFRIKTGRRKRVCPISGHTLRTSMQKLFNQFNNICLTVTNDFCQIDTFIQCRKIDRLHILITVQYSTIQSNNFNRSIFIIDCYLVTVYLDKIIDSILFKTLDIGNRNNFRLGFTLPNLNMDWMVISLLVEVSEDASPNVTS